MQFSLFRSRKNANHGDIWCKRSRHALRARSFSSWVPGHSLRQCGQAQCKNCLLPFIHCKIAEIVSAIQPIKIRSLGSLAGWTLKNPIPSAKSSITFRIHAAGPPPRVLLLTLSNSFQAAAQGKYCCSLAEKVETSLRVGENEKMSNPGLSLNSGLSSQFLAWSLGCTAFSRPC